MSKFLFHIVPHKKKRPCFAVMGDKVVSIAQDGHIVRDAFCVTNGAVNQFMQDAHYPDGYGISDGTSLVDLFYQTCTTETSRGAWTECGLPVPIPSLGGSVVELDDPDIGTTVTYNADIAWTLIFNLIPHRHYRWRVLDSGRSVVRSGGFDTTGTVRQIRLKGIRNVRDLGGFKCTGGTIKYNLLWRGNHTDNVLEQDIAEIKRWGITAQLDLRSKSKQYTGSDLGLKYYGTKYNSKKVAIEDKYGIAAYDELITNPKNLLNCIKAIVTELESGGSIYFHCLHGSDRTGSLTAVIMGLLGCSESDIIKMWEMTSFWGDLNTKRIHIEDGEGEMRSMLKALYKYGGSQGATVPEQIELWFRSVVCKSLSDLGADWIARLRNVLIQPD